MFRDLALAMTAQTRCRAGELTDLVSILDASVIGLSGRGHGWAIASRTRNKTQGLKLHLQYAPEADLVEYIEITGNNINDITVGHRIVLEAGRIYVFDKAYLRLQLVAQDHRGRLKLRHPAQDQRRLQGQ